MSRFFQDEGLGRILAEIVALRREVESLRCEVRRTTDAKTITPRHGGWGMTAPDPKDWSRYGFLSAMEGV